MTAVLTISILLFLCYTALLIYYRQSWLSIPEFEPQTTNYKPQTTNHKPQTTNYKPQTTNYKPQTRITVVIAARNEEKNIAACLESISDQSYPKDLYEVLVVDDHSTDNSASIIKMYESQNVKLISLKDLVAGEGLNSYKKKAIEIAIQRSSGELIITTDADCVVPVNWLQTIAAFYEQHWPAFIAAPVSINCGNRFIEIFQALDFMTLQGITGASVHKKIHSMCNGANLAYTKKAFEEAGGFSGIDTIASGDDMLLMHKIYKQHPGKVMFLRSKEVIVQTEPVKTIGEFFSQRIRWASKANKYDDKRIFWVLLLVYLVNVLLLVLPVIAVFENVQYSMFNIQCSLTGVWLVLLLLKTLTELFFLYPVARFFGKQPLLWLFPLMQPVHILYTIIAGGLGAFGSYTWKERRVK